MPPSPTRPHARPVATLGALARRLWGRARIRLSGGPVVGGPRPGDRLPPAPWLGRPSVRLAVVGDAGTGDWAAFATGTAIEKAAGEHPFDALVLLGDNVYPDGDPDLVDPLVHRPFAGVLGRGARLLAILGNHDVQRGQGHEVAARLGMPDRWYAERLGDLLFVGLDSTQVERPGQLSWLEDVLAANDARWVVAAVHHPPWSAGWHGSTRSVQRTWCPLLEAHGVALVLSGHEHDYQRSVPLGGTTYVVSGGGADHLRITSRDWFTAASWSVHHFLDVRVHDDRMVVEAVDHDGAVVDRTTLRR
jgi:hypothetical protein